MEDLFAFFDESTISTKPHASIRKRNGTLRKSEGTINRKWHVINNNYWNISLECNDVNVIYVGFIKERGK